MIIRLMGQGQWSVDADQLADLNTLDNKIDIAVADNDQAALTEALTHLSEEIKRIGLELPEGALEESELFVPDPSATVEEVAELLEATTHAGFLPDDV